MPDVNFYNNLKWQAEELRECLILLDRCMSNVTSLMEQASHLQSDLDNVPPVAILDAEWHIVND